MPTRATFRGELAAILPHGEAVRGYLTTRSGLPGPRANLELLGAFGDVAPAELVRELLLEDDEYLRCCGVSGLGRLLTEGPDEGSAGLVAELRAHASDSSWRVRETVATALQRLGDAAPGRLRLLVAPWALDADPLVQRAAVAGICEPRLLKDPATAAAALDACAVATAALARRPAATRREPSVRTLRQALGYCWSVAVAGDPEHGLRAFAALRAQAETTATADVDVAWIVRENLKKARLRRLLGE